jgi:perosamine synthetase
VDLYGNVADMDAICSIARAHDITVIEDAAEAVGAELNGRMAGSLGNVGVFSFHGSKTLTSGEGGLLATNDADIFRRAQVLRDHGREPGDVAFFNRAIGFKYKMSSMQAALALAQLERLPELIARKRQIIGWYRTHLGNDPRLTLNQETPGTTSTYWMITAVFRADIGIEKVSLAAELAKEGIDTRPFFYPLSSLPAFSDQTAGRRYADENPVSYDISPRAINLPSALCLTEEDVAFTAAVVRRVLDAQPLPSRPA